MPPIIPLFPLSPFPFPTVPLVGVRVPPSRICKARLKAGAMFKSETGHLRKQVGLVS